LWLADYRLACQLGGTDDDNLIIRNLPLFLSDTVGVLGPTAHPGLPLKVFLGVGRCQRL
jgi:hypothetical protein